MMKRINKKTVWGFFCCLALALLVACTEEQVETTGSIYGIVNDATNGEPVPMAHVSLNPGGKATNTGSDGRYEFLNMEPGQYTIQISKSGYVTNTKQITVVAGQQASGDMLLTSEQQEADIRIDPTSLNFGTTQDELVVTLTNQGNAATDWALELGENPWLSASLLSGNIAAGKTQSIIFSVDRDKLSETKNVKISLSAFGNSYTISVSCAPVNAKSEMSVTPTELDFGAGETEKAITIKNTGNAILNWNVSGITEACLSVSAEEGSVEADGSKVIKVMLDRSKLTSDLNTSFIISDGIKEQTITVKSSKAVAEMVISPSALDFGEESTEKTFTISNTGTAELVWNITVPDGKGVNVSETSGVTAPQSSKQITVTLDRAMMTEDLHTSLEISDGSRKETVTVTAIKGSEIAGTVVTQGLYTYYKFDDNFEDATENGIDGFGTASPAFVEGVTAGSKAVKFSKTGNSTFVVSKPIIDSRQMTISFWGKDFEDGHIFHLSSSIRSEAMFTLSMSNGALKFLVTRYNNMYQYSNLPAFVHPTLTDGKWHHIALVSDFEVTTYSTITTTLYVDGQEVYTLTEDANHFSENGGSQSSYDTGTSFTMGGSLQLNKSMTLTGTNMSVDNFRVYDTRRLSASEIQEIYNAKQ
ncbi:carboxypeptidase regulatory-like domain-containing protein [Phocaeicola barnesiae]|uniref:BACON domain-containing protein n=1 Tax=Phocaeicola barnesiae TaxID=376804 RepID=UPI0025A39130|nr:carboxypeptidase regulatory-like domain-containing protein [Phocaeicola barnesiae]MDM8240852.1 carboxypeptidase regulatory-like domain-containing protein [Phocaeicola barnesiae]